MVDLKFDLINNFENEKENESIFKKKLIPQYL